MPKQKAEKIKSKGGRPRKPAPAFHEGDRAALRFKAGMMHVLAGGPQPQEKP